MGRIDSTKHSFRKAMDALCPFLTQYFPEFSSESPEANIIETPEDELFPEWGWNDLIPVANNDTIMVPNMFKWYRIPPSIGTWKIGLFTGLNLTISQPDGMLVAQGKASMKETPEGYEIIIGEMPVIQSGTARMYRIVQKYPMRRWIQCDMSSLQLTSKNLVVGDTLHLSLKLQCS